MASKSQYQLNKEIEDFVIKKKSPYTQEEIAFVNRYSGYGGMWSFDANLANTPARGLYEYYTPIPVIEKMIGLANKYGYPTGPILEPSAGIGRFLHYFVPTDEVVALEPDMTSYLIAKANFPKFQILNQTFNELFVDRKGKVRDAKIWQNKYGLVIGNPPYGSFQGRFTTQEKKVTQARTYVEYFILRGLMCLKKSGLLIYIIPSSFLDGDHSPAKEKISELGQLIDAYRLPVRIFEQTDIQTDIVVFKKL